MELALPRRKPDPAGDRLATAIFVAALLHGLLILGVRFSAPSPAEDPLPTLEVLLVPSGPDDPRDNRDAAYLAERTQLGTGTGQEAKRASLPEDHPQVRPEAEASQENPEQAPLETLPPGDVSVLGSRALDAQRLAVGAETPVEPPVFHLQPAPEVPTLGRNATVADRELYLRGRAADGTLLADTRESAIAAYLDGWKRRIERVGTLNFPNEARRRSMSGNPVLEVAVRADGRLESVTVRRSSGHRELDSAAVGIVKLAAPFDPFPNALRERYPVLRFAYEWQFLNGRLGGDGAVFTDAP